MLLQATVSSEFQYFVRGLNSGTCVFRYFRSVSHVLVEECIKMNLCCIGIISQDCLYISVV